MNYFTYELWKKINNTDIKTREEANLQWLKNIDLYREHFEKIERHLSKDFLKKFKKNGGFHDFEFKTMLIEQSINSSPKIRIIMSLHEETWELTYKGIDKIDIQYAIDKNVLGFGIGFNTVGYNEFSIIDSQTIAHEMLLSSGATILIHFKRILARKY